jgi:hypothetical protein
MTSQELITQEVQKLIETVKKSFKDIKRIALSEAWKVLQLAIATVVQIVEAIGTDLSSPDKKQLAMNLLSEFYDKVFLIVDVPVVPNLLEPVIHKYVKAFLMLLVSSTIDSMVTVFRNTGVFKPKTPSVEVV